MNIYILQGQKWKKRKKRRGFTFVVHAEKVEQRADLREIKRRLGRKGLL